MYNVTFDRQARSYKVRIGLSMFMIEEDGAQMTPLAASRFWKGLA